MGVSKHHLKSYHSIGGAVTLLFGLISMSKDRQSSTTADTSSCPGTRTSLPEQLEHGRDIFLVLLSFLLFVAVKVVVTIRKSESALCDGAQGVRSILLIWGRGQWKRREDRGKKREGGSEIEAKRGERSGLSEEKTRHTMCRIRWR